MANALEVEKLQVVLGGAPVLDELSFSVAQGSSLAIIGPNGAGKTVLLRALIGALPSRGAIRWMPGARIGYVPQKLDIARDVPLSGMDLLVAKRNVVRASEEISTLLERVGLAPATVAKPIGTLSGGQFQRLLFAIALIGHPDVLLLDEPTAGIDQPGQERLNELVRRVQQDEGLTVLLISHDLSVVYRYATNVLCLARDRPFLGPPREILTPQMLSQVYGTPAEFHVHVP
jgi:zinc transport system ATP-binding protein